MKLFLAIDDSEYSQTAVRAVIAQYRSDGTEVRVLTVVDWPPSFPESLAFTPGVVSEGPILELHEETIRQGERLVAVAAERLRGTGFAATEEVREGDPRNVILERAADWGADVIVLGSHGRRGVESFLLGSVSENVVRHARCSVAVIRGVVV